MRAGRLQAAVGEGSLAGEVGFGDESLKGSSTKDGDVPRILWSGGDAGAGRAIRGVAFSKMMVVRAGERRAAMASSTVREAELSDVLRVDEVVIRVVVVPDERRTAVPTVLVGRIEQASNGGSAAREGDHHGGVAASASFSQQRIVHGVVEEVVAPAAALLAVVVNVKNGVPSDRSNRGG